MTISTEILAAYVDGELSEMETARVRRAIAEDSALAEQVVQLTQLRGLLSARFDPVLAEPVPQRLTDTIAAAAKVVDLSSVRAARQRWFQRPMVRYAAAPALAACLVLVFVVGRTPRDAVPGYAAGELATALDETLSGETAPDGTRLLLSFRTADGAACRAYSGDSSSGIACHDEKGWKVQMTGSESGTRRTDYRQAGSDDAALMAAAQNMAAGPALDRSAEQVARSANWRRKKL